MVRGKAVRKNIGADEIRYTASDNSFFILKKGQDITALLKHCTDNNLTLTDDQGNELIKKEVKSKKK